MNFESPVHCVQHIEIRLSNNDIVQNVLKVKFNPLKFNRINFNF